MGVEKDTVYFIKCDECGMHPQWRLNERGAKCEAEIAGYVQINDKWLCPECAAELKQKGEAE